MTAAWCVVGWLVLWVRQIPRKGLSKYVLDALLVLFPNRGLVFYFRHAASSCRA